jgi:predicted GNAT family acetyltransferase
MTDESVAASTDVVIKDNPERSRFEIWVGDELAGFSQYRRRGDEYTFIHTETEPAFAGQGLAGRLVSAALDEVRARGASVLPMCPFVRVYIKRHPHYLDLVPEAEQSRYDLP